jgi:hypothetical protein
VGIVSYTAKQETPAVIPRWNVLLIFMNVICMMSVAHPPPKEDYVEGFLLLGISASS